MAVPKIVTCEMHCGGEPVRIVESGFPYVHPDTILNMRKYVKENFDEYRTMLMLEPRGHGDMYGALLVQSTNVKKPRSGVLFMHNSGYSPMCGHATLALARYFADRSTTTSNIETEQDEVEITIEAPCGLVRTFVALEDKPGREKGEARFISVEAYTACRDLKIEFDASDLGPSIIPKITVDIAYGGAYYGILNMKSVGIEFGQTPLPQIIEIAARIKKRINEVYKIEHPVAKDLSFVYGIIFTDDTRLFDHNDPQTINITVFAEGQVDRSPTGSGVTARMALLYEKSLVPLHKTITFISGVNNSRFKGTSVEEVEWCQKRCVRVEVKGKAYYTGRCEFSWEHNDPLAHGFHV